MIILYLAMRKDGNGKKPPEGMSPKSGFSKFSLSTFRHETAANQWVMILPIQVCPFPQPTGTWSVCLSIQPAKKHVCHFLNADLQKRNRHCSVRHLFNGSRKTHSVIFTSGATQSLQLLGEHFPWRSGGCFLYADESHTSPLDALDGGSGYIGVGVVKWWQGVKFWTIFGNRLRKRYQKYMEPV